MTDKDEFRIKLKNKLEIIHDKVDNLSELLKHIVIELDEVFNIAFELEWEATMKKIEAKKIINTEKPKRRAKNTKSIDTKIVNTVIYESE